MASMPAYDPNTFSDGISHSEWEMMRQDERHPLINKTLNALYPPGSTFKPAVAMALMEAGVDPEETVSCGGGYTLGNRRYGCLGVHGPMNLHRAIAKSCNTYFYTMGRRIGIERFSAMAQAARPRPALRRCRWSRKATAPSPIRPGSSAATSRNGASPTRSTPRSARAM